MTKTFFVILFSCFTSFGFCQTENNLSSLNLFEFAEPEEGSKAFYQYLAQNIKYPQSAIENKIKGTVLLQILINKHGRLTEVKVIRNLHPECDKEAKRVVESYTKKWINNTGKTARLSIPIIFRL